MKYPLILSSLLLLAACSESPAPESTQQTEVLNVVVLTDAQLANAALQTGKPDVSTFQGEVVVNGLITVPPQREASAGFPLGGFVESVLVTPGSRIDKGSIIAYVQDPALIQLQEDYLVNRSALSTATSERERQEQLFASKATSERALQDARANEAAIRIRIRALEERLLLAGIDADRLQPGELSRKVAVRAPISGTVTQVNGHPGTYLQPTDPIALIVSDDELVAELTVFERDLAGLREGSAVWIHGSTGEAVECTIARINRIVDAQHAGKVYCSVPAGSTDLSPGVFITARIARTTNKSLALPVDAIVHWEDVSYAFAVRDKGRFEMVRIETGLSNDSLVEVRGIPGMEDQVFVTRNAYTLLMQLRNTAEE